jgi:hypothetical protein
VRIESIPAMIRVAGSEELAVEFVALLATCEFVGERELGELAVERPSFVC